MDREQRMVSQAQLPVIPLTTSPPSCSMGPDAQILFNTYDKLLCGAHGYHQILSDIQNSSQVQKARRGVPNAGTEIYERSSSSPIASSLYLSPVND